MPINGNTPLQYPFPYKTDDGNIQSSGGGGGSGVTDFTGDGTVLNNSGSTGNVTATLATHNKNLVLASSPTTDGAIPTFRALVAADLPSSGSVTSVDVSVPGYMSSTGGPITSSGTIALDFTSENANKVFAAPDGSTGVPSFRVLAPNDLPFSFNQNSEADVNITNSNSGTSTQMILDLSTNTSGSIKHTQFGAVGAGAKTSPSGSATIKGAGVVRTISDVDGLDLLCQGTNKRIRLGFDDGSTTLFPVVVDEQTTNTNIMSLAAGFISLTMTGNVTLTKASATVQYISSYTSGTITLPSSSTCSQGLLYFIVNGTATNIDVYTDSAGLFQTLPAGQSIIVVNKSVTGANNFALVSISGSSGGGAVSSITGDGTLINNSASIGSVTLTIPTVTTGNSFYGSADNTANTTPSFRQLVGGDLPNPTTFSKGGVFALNPITSNFVTGIDGSGIPQIDQPTFGDILGFATVPQGGTGKSSLTPYAVITGGTTSTGLVQQVVGTGTSGQALISNGASTLPSWQSVVSGVSSITGDGTIFSNSASTGAVTLTPTASTANTVLSGGTTPSWKSLFQARVQNNSAGNITLLFSDQIVQIVNGSTGNITINLPNSSLCQVGQMFIIVNDSSNNITLIDSGGTNNMVIFPQRIGQAINFTNTAAFFWYFSILPSNLSGNQPLADGQSGGTGLISYAAGDITYAATTSSPSTPFALSKLSIGSAGQYLGINAGLPQWTNPITNPGFTDYTTSGTKTMLFSDPSYVRISTSGVSIKLPDSSTCVLGQVVTIRNNSTSTNLIKNSSGSSAQFLLIGASGSFVNTSTSGADNFTPFNVSPGIGSAYQIFNTNSGGTNLQWSSAYINTGTTNTNISGTTFSVPFPTPGMQRFNGNTSTNQQINLYDNVVNTLGSNNHIEIINANTGTGSLIIKDSTGSTTLLTLPPGNGALCYPYGTGATTNWTFLTFAANASGVQPSLATSLGGTGLTSLTTYALLAGGTTSTGNLQQITALGTSGQVLTSNGAGALPSFQTISGGGAVTSITGDGILFNNSASAGAVTLTATTNAANQFYAGDNTFNAMFRGRTQNNSAGNVVLVSTDLPVQIINGSTADIDVTLPNTSTCSIGQTFIIINNSSNKVTLYDDGGSNHITIFSNRIVQAVNFSTASLDFWYWAALPSNYSGNFPVLSGNFGGTGQIGYTSGDILFAGSTSSLTSEFNLSKLTVGSNGQVLTVVSGLPSWQTLSPGTGSVTLVSATTQQQGQSVAVTNPTTTPSINFTNVTTLDSSTAAGGTQLWTAGTLIRYFSSGSTNTVYVLPATNASTSGANFATGMNFLVVNNSTAVITVKDNATTTLKTLSPGTWASFIILTIANPGTFQIISGNESNDYGNGITGQVLTSTGSGASWQDLLPARTQNNSAGDVTLTGTDATVQIITGSTADRTVFLPNSSGATLGKTFYIYNQSSNNVFIQDTNSNFITLLSGRAGFASNCFTSAGNNWQWGVLPSNSSNNLPVLDTNFGGTGLTSLNTNRILAGGTTSTGTLQQLASGTSGQALVSAGASLPAFGTLGVGGGGTGQTSFTGNSVILSNGAGNSLTTAVTGNEGYVLTKSSAGVPTFQALYSGRISNNSGGSFSLSVTDVPVQIVTGITANIAIVLPNPASLTVGRMFYISNQSSNTVQLQDTNANAFNIPTGRMAFALNVSTTSNALWHWGVYPSSPSNTAPFLETGFGGTGLTSLTTYGLVAGGLTSTGPLQQVSTGASGQALISGGSIALPAFGTLGYLGGGTGQNSWVAGDMLYASATNTLSRLAIGSTNQYLTVNSGVPSWSYPNSGNIYATSGVNPQVLLTSSENIQSYTGGTTGLVVKLPDTSTCTTGQFWELNNNSSVNITVNYSDNTSCAILLPQYVLKARCKSVGSVKSYNFSIIPFATSTTASPAYTANLGGTGLTSLTTYALLAGGTTSTSPLQQVATGTLGYALTSGGSGALPSFNILSVGGGGTGLGGLATNQIMTGGTTVTNHVDQINNGGTVGLPLLTSGSSASKPNWGVLSVGGGGTGLTSLAVGSLIYGTGSNPAAATNSPSALANIMNFNGSVPTWSMGNTQTGTATFISNGTNPTFSSLSSYVNLCQVGNIVSMELAIQFTINSSGTGDMQIQVSGVTLPTTGAATQSNQLNVTVRGFPDQIYCKVVDSVHMDCFIGSIPFAPPFSGTINTTWSATVTGTHCRVNDFFTANGFNQPLDTLNMNATWCIT